ncbi:MAG: glycerol-3-phosphate dehydrogenase, partial [Paracoccaceae bacterium]
LLANMPHIAHAMRFVLPHSRGMRPAWLLRLGLFIYDHLGGRKLLPGTRTLNLADDPAGVPLKPELRRAFDYSDGFVDDARLVVLNARDAADRGAHILTRTELTRATRRDGLWYADITDRRTGRTFALKARSLVNAGGPWVNLVIKEALGTSRHDPIRLVRGSHIVTRKLFDHDRAYFFQNADGRIIFAIPYEEDFTLIGTTDIDHAASPDCVSCTTREIDYLCSAASEYFVEPVTKADVVWTYAGVRPLDDDHGGSASKASRDYHFRIEDENDTAPLISIYGGKITTFRKLAATVVGMLGRYVELSGLPWTDHTPLPGGDFTYGDIGAIEDGLRRKCPDLDERTVRRMARAYGTRALLILGGAGSVEDLGEDFGAGLYEAELRWLVANEWAERVEDIIWRRTKCGLRMAPAQVSRLEEWLREHGQ